MSMNAPTRENFKEKAKVIRSFIKEKYNVDISHSHCIELMSQLFGFKDWNTAAAALKSEGEKTVLPFYIKTVGDLKKALATFEDSDTIDAMYEFKAKDLIDEVEAEELGPDDVIIQEFSFVLNQPRDPFGIASLDLKLENEDISLIL